MARKCIGVVNDTWSFIVQQNFKLRKIFEKGTGAFETFHTVPYSVKVNLNLVLIACAF